MLQSVFIYTFIILVMLLLAIGVKKRSMSCVNFSKCIVDRGKFWYPEVIFLILFFSLMFGMRYNVGTDHLSYLYAYLNDSVEVSRFEPLFRWITNYCVHLSIHPVIYFSIWAFVQITFFLLAFKNELYLLPLLIFFLFFNGEYFFWMNGIRQALAMCIWVYSIKYIYTKKIWRYILWCGVAFLFHKSAIILILLYPILKEGKGVFKNIPLQLILFVSVIVIRNMFEPFILNFVNLIEAFKTLLGGYESYTMDAMLEETKGEVEGTGLAFIFKTIVWIMIVLYSNRIKSFYNSKKINIFYFLFFIGILFEYAIPSGAVALTRPFRYLYVFKTVMLAYFVYYLLQDKTHKYNKLLAYLIIVAFIGIFYLNQINLPEDNCSWFRFYFQEM